MIGLLALEEFDGYVRLFADAAFWEPYVKQVCQKHSLSPDGPVRIGVPGTCPTFIIAERWVIKFFGRLFNGAQAYRVEEEAARLAAQDPAIRSVPVIASGQLNGETWPWPYLIYPFIPGTSLGEQAGLMDWGAWFDIASELGQMIRRLHGLSLDGSAVFPNDLDAYREFLSSQRAACLQNHSEWGSLPVHLINQLESFLPEVNEMIGFHAQPHLIHADLTRDHLLGRAQNGRWETLALIDFGDAMTGSLLYELAALHLDLFRSDRRLLSAFLDAYGLDREERRRLPRMAMAAALLHQFNVMEYLPEDYRRLPSLEDLAAALW